MSVWILLATALHTGGLVLFGGGLFWFALILTRVNRSRAPEITRIFEDEYRVTSMGMSVGLATLIFGGLLRHYLLFGAFHWATDSTHALLYLAKCLLFLAAWIHWGWFEVVTQHQFRAGLLAQEGEIPAEFEASRARVRRGLRIQLAFFALVLLLGASARAVT